jgi:hypothetical protein
MPPFSKHLFWDVDSREIDPEKHEAWLVRRVLEHGYWDDWKLVVAIYGMQRLRDTVTRLRTLEPRAFAFCRAIFDLPASAFRCSTWSGRGLTPEEPAMPTE